MPTTASFMRSATSCLDAYIASSDLTGDTQWKQQAYCIQVPPETVVHSANTCCLSRFDFWFTSKYSQIRYPFPERCCMSAYRCIGCRPPQPTRPLRRQQAGPCPKYGSQRVRSYTYILHVFRWVHLRCPNIPGKSRQVC
jgi:hypothetical protein